MTSSSFKITVSLNALSALSKCTKNVSSAINLSVQSVFHIIYPTALPVIRPLPTLSLKMAPAFSPVLHCITLINRAVSLVLLLFPQTVKS